MKYLLDTHIWIWSLLAPAQLSDSVIQVLENQQSELWLSPISVWEFLVLVEKGRVELEKDVDEWLAEATRTAPLREAPLTIEIARKSRLIDLPHQDPADRFLAATAIVLELTLITSDDSLLHSTDFAVLPNR